MVLQPIPGVADAGGVQLVEPRADTGSYPGASWLEYRDLRDRHAHAARSVRLSAWCRSTSARPAASERTSRPARVGQLLFRARPEAGARPLPAAGRSGRAPAARRSSSSRYAYWQTRFGGAPSVLGRTLRVNDRQLTIVGVAPERFQGTVTMLTFDLWVPATMAPELLAGSRELEDRGQRGYNVAGRLAPRATRTRGADRARRRRCAQLAHDYPETNKTMQRRGAAVLAGAARAAAVLRRRARRSCRASCCCCCSRSAATPRT